MTNNRSSEGAFETIIAHALNPELEGCYSANRLRLTRQLDDLPRSEDPLDGALGLNGIPAVTLAQRSSLTGQIDLDASA